MRLLGITGKAGAGKSTAAEAITPALEGHRAAFAAALKTDAAYLLRQLYGLRVDVNNPRVKRKVRPLLQGLASLRDLVGPDFWVDRLFDNVAKEEATHGDRLWVIDDVRYPNEADRIRAHGGIVVKVTAPEWIRRMRLDMPPAAFAAMEGHPSETSVDLITADLVLSNGGNDVEDFQRYAVEAVQGLLARREAAS